MAVHRASVALVVTVWISVTLFGAYILAHYAGAVTDADLPSWNAVLPRLYETTTPAATVAIGVHFLAGGVILVLGCVQLLSSVGARWPTVHRWLGRVYMVACLLACPDGINIRRRACGAENRRDACCQAAGRPLLRRISRGG